MSNIASKAPLNDSSAGKLGSPPQAFMKVSDEPGMRSSRARFEVSPAQFSQQQFSQQIPERPAVHLSAVPSPGSPIPPTAHPEDDEGPGVLNEDNPDISGTVDADSDAADQSTGKIYEEAAEHLPSSSNNSRSLAPSSKASQANSTQKPAPRAARLLNGSNNFPTTQENRLRLGNPPFINHEAIERVVKQTNEYWFR